MANQAAASKQLQSVDPRACLRKELNLKLTMSKVLQILSLQPHQHEGTAR